MEYVLEKFSNLCLQENNSSLAKVYSATNMMEEKIAKTALVQYFSLKLRFCSFSLE